MNFLSDNLAGAAPEILKALLDAGTGTAASYGRDVYSRAVEQGLAEIFDHEVAVLQVVTGGAANGLALSAYTPAYGAVLTHEAAHIETDECGGPEFYTGGAKLIALKSHGGKLTPEVVEKGLQFYADDPATAIHRVRPRALSLTQATEYGLVYSLDELTAICETARSYGLAVHVDGARFANALATLDCSPAEASWKRGVDVLCLGATKNGALAAETVIFFDLAKAEEARSRSKRAGHLLSKGRFLGAQLQAYFADDLWLRLARHANGLARRLADGLAQINGIELPYDTEANMVFAIFPPDVEMRLREGGAAYGAWVYPGDPWQGRLRRMVCSFETTEDEVDRFLELCAPPKP